jgi:hypothetical protein
MQVFDQDDDGYVDWLESNPHGFVLNSYRRPKASYLILHQVECKSVSRIAEPPVRWTTSDFIKVCAANVAEIEAWCRKEAGSSPLACGKCKPLSPG